LKNPNLYISQLEFDILKTSLQNRINKFYFLSNNLKIFILLKFYIDFLQKLRKIEKNYVYDSKGKCLVLDNEETDKPNSPTNNPSIYSGVLLHSGEFVYEDMDLHIVARQYSIRAEFV